MSQSKYKRIIRLATYRPCFLTVIYNNSESKK